MGKSVTIYIDDHKEVIAQLEEYQNLQAKFAEGVRRGLNAPLFKPYATVEDVNRATEIASRFGMMFIPVVLHKLKEGE